MKKFEYKFKFKPVLYDYIMKDVQFNEHKMEKQILELLVKGKTCYEIADQLGYSDRTIVRRRKDLYERLSDYMI